MKKVYYDEGPEMQKFGRAGLFLRGKPREIDDALADQLLRKGRVKEYVDPATKPRKTEKEE